MSDRVWLEDELLEAVRDARPGLSGGELSPGGAQGRAVLERVLVAPRRARARRARRGVPLVLATGAAMLVVAVAVFTLRGHAPLRSGGAPGSGEIVARDGRVLPAAIVGQLGLAHYYGGELRHGDKLKTSLDSSLQRVGQHALARAISARPGATGGAFVALDPVSGQVYAIGSLPVGGSLNRVTQLAGPVGSTFAPITAIAALASGAWSAADVYDDTGQFCFDGQCRHNAGVAVYGPLDVTSALKVGSNDFFYNLGVLTDSAAPAGGPVQAWARALGLGHPTGIDLPDESPGTLPTPAWRTQRNRLEYECDTATGPFAGRSKYPPGGCGIADGTNRPWSAGDNENLAVGQGDVQVTPLQLAVAYAAIENGGTVVRPHLGVSIDAPGGRVLRAIDPPPARHLKLGGLDLADVQRGLHAASAQPGGDSADVFARFPVAVYGETGTARYNGQQDYAWYAGFIPAADGVAPIVVVVTVAQGGFGDAAAAPVARQLFSQWLFGRPGPWVVGASRTL
jgi:penicillin-binding protein 2